MNLYTINYRHSQKHITGFMLAYCIDEEAAEYFAREKLQQEYELLDPHNFALEMREIYEPGIIVHRRDYY